MIDPKNFAVIRPITPPDIKNMMYGGSQPVSTPVVMSNLYRLRRGYPYPRRGVLVQATPQFKTLTLYSPTSANAQLPGTTVTPVSITYPRKTK